MWQKIISGICNIHNVEDIDSPNKIKQNQFRKLFVTKVLDIINQAIPCNENEIYKTIQKQQDA